MVFRFRAITIRRCVEPFLHACPIFVGLGFAISPSFLHLYNRSHDGMCILSPYPTNCLNDDSVVCRRGSPENYTKLNTILVSWVGINLLTILLCLFLVLGKMKLKERDIQFQSRFLRSVHRSSQYNLRAAQDTKIIAKQIVGYFFVFSLTHILLMLNLLEPGKDFTVVIQIIIPAQGIFNCIIFLWHKCYSAQRMQSLSNFERPKSCWMLLLSLFVGSITEPYIFCNLDAVEIGFNKEKAFAAHDEIHSVVVGGGDGDIENNTRTTLITSKIHTDTTSMEVLAQGVDWSSSALFFSNPRQELDNHSIGKEQSSVKEEEEPCQNPDRKYYAGVQAIEPHRKQSSEDNSIAGQDESNFIPTSNSPNQFFEKNSTDDCSRSFEAVDVDEKVLFLYDNLDLCLTP